MKRMNHPEEEAAAWEVIAARMADIKHHTNWLAKASKPIGSITQPAPGYAAAVHNLEMAKARARGAAQVMAIFLGTTADEIAAEAARRFG